MSNASNSGQNRESMPSEGLFVQLPKWAAVAVAIRCARRTFNLSSSIPNFTWYEQYSGIAEETMVFSEYVVRVGALPAGVSLRNLQLVMDEEAGRNSIEETIIFAAKTANQAVLGNERSVWNRGVHAIQSSILAVDAYARSGMLVETVGFKDAFNDAVRRDVDILFEMSRKELWDNDTPVPVSVLGPLWQVGTPAGWPGQSLTPTEESEEKRSRQELLVELVISADASDEEVHELTQRYVNALSELHISNGGQGLKIDDLQIWSDEPSRVEVVL